MPDSYVPKNWLIKRITVGEAEAAHMVIDGRPGLGPVPFGFLNKEWRALLDQMTQDDELWEYSSSSESWKALAGRAGIALVRNGEVVDSILTVMN
jgi:hypothetical protein